MTATMESETDLQREEFFQNVDLNAFPIVLQFDFLSERN